MDRLSFELTVYALAAGLCVLSPAIVTGQHQKTVPESTAWEVPRMADGQPDLQGVWDFRSLTPLERPRHLGDQDVFTVIVVLGAGPTKTVVGSAQTSPSTDRHRKERCPPLRHESHRLSRMLFVPFAGEALGLW
jgi:hypothetical protein